MTSDRRDLDTTAMSDRLRVYLSDGPTTSSTAARQAVRSAISATPQRRGWAVRLTGGRSWGVLAVSAVVAVTLVAGAVWSLFTIAGKVAAPGPTVLPSAQPLTLPSNSTAALPSPSHPDVLLSAPLSGQVDGFVAVDGELWVLKRSGTSMVLQHLDRKTLTAAATVTISTGASATNAQLVAAGGVLWVAVDGKPLTMVDPRTGVAVITSTVASGPISGAGQSLWAVVGRAVAHLDPATGAIVAQVPLPGAVRALAADDDHVWAMLDDGELVRIDPRTNQVVGRSTLPAGSAGVRQGQLVLTASTAWLIDPADGSRVIGFDATTGTPTVALPLPDGPATQVRAGKAAVWALMDQFVISRVDPSAGVVSDALTLGGMAIDIVDDPSAVVVVTSGAIEAIAVP